jgi:hypothetical protein
LIDNPALTERVRAVTAAVLNINNIVIKEKKSASEKSVA